MMYQERSETFGVNVLTVIQKNGPNKQNRRKRSRCRLLVADQAIAGNRTSIKTEPTDSSIKRNVHDPSVEPIDWESMTK